MILHKKKKKTQDNNLNVDTSSNQRKVPETLNEPLRRSKKTFKFHLLSSLSLIG